MKLFMWHLMLGKLPRVEGSITIEQQVLEHSAMPKQFVTSTQGVPKNAAEGKRYAKCPLLPSDLLSSRSNKRRTPRDGGTRGRGRGGRKLFTENVGHGVYHCPQMGKTIFNTVSSQPPAPNKPSQTLAPPPFQQGHAGWMRDGLAYNPNGRTGVTAAQLKKMLPKRGGRSMGTDRAIGSFGEEYTRVGHQ
ncbi:hypothetical protein ACFE04_008582 [Oxalis oulophora]